MGPLVRAPDVCGRLIRLEPEVERLVLLSLREVAFPAVAEHQLIVCREVFRVDRESLLELLDRFIEAGLPEEDLAQLVVDIPIAREHAQDLVEQIAGPIVLPQPAERLRVEELRASSLIRR